jgi:hypothetical protein
MPAVRCDEVFIGLWFGASRAERKRAPNGAPMKVDSSALPSAPSSTPDHPAQIEAYFGSKEAVRTP